MNVLFQKALDYITFFVNNPFESLVLFFVSIIVSAMFLKYVYRERIATLEERVKLRDDHITFYKNLNAELEKKASSVPSSVVTDADKKDIREHIMSAISKLESKTGRALSIEIFDLLKHDFEFGVVLSEMLRMQEAGIINWVNSPNPPDAHTQISKVLRYGPP